MSTTTVWREFLQSPGLPEPIVNAQEVDEVVAIVQRHRIDLQLFGGNLIALLSGGRASMSLFGEKPADPTSPSVQSLTNPLHRPVSLPLWFLAGFPDVVNWLQQIHSGSTGDDMPDDEFTSLYGVDPTLVEDDLEKVLVNSDGQVRAKYYAHAIDEYVKRTGRILETTVREGSASDIYSGQKLMDALGEESNFTLIARNTAMCYIELRNFYREKFSDETALIACAGAVDAMAYIVGTRQVRVEQLITLSAEVAGKANHLLEFIICLEALLLSADTPNVTPSEVLDACRNQAGAINKAIGEVLLSGNVNDGVRSAVQFFMNDRKLKKVRRQLSIPRG